jgi:pilus assembly protein Flp/PilA
MGKAEQLAQPQVSKTGEKTMLKIQMFIHKLLNPLANKEGATAVEYGLMVALIAAVIITSVALVGTNLDKLYDAVGGKIPTTVP